MKKRRRINFTYRDTVILSRHLILQWYYQLPRLPVANGNLIGEWLEESSLSYWIPPNCILHPPTSQRKRPFTGEISDLLPPFSLPAIRGRCRLFHPLFGIRICASVDFFNVVLFFFFLLNTKRAKIKRNVSPSTMWVITCFQWWTMMWFMCFEYSVIYAEIKNLHPLFTYFNKGELFCRCCCLNNNIQALITY